MMKKPTAALLAATLALLPGLTGHASAQENTAVQIQGKYVMGYTMIPLRVVSTALGAEVKWDHKTFTAWITKDDIEIKLPTNSASVEVNGEGLLMDTRSRLEGGVTYVPLRFVAQTLGGTVSWDASTGTASAALGDRKVAISTQLGTRFPAITASRINALVKAANESADLSAFKQVRTHFRPYFTDGCINKLIQRKGAEVALQFDSKPYTSFYEGEGYGSISQLGISSNTIERTIMVRCIDGVWKAEEISYTILSS